MVASLAAIGFSSRHRSHYLGLYLWFWVVYFMRMLYDTHYYAELLSREAQDYWIWSIGGCFLPGLAMFVATSNGSIKRAFYWILYVSVAASLLVLVYGQTSFFFATTEKIIDINRLNLASLNPISAGHLGGTTLLLGITLSLSRRGSKILLTTAITAIISGMALIILSNSRGPLIAVASVLLVFFIFRMRSVKVWMVTTLFLVCALGASITFQETIFGERGVTTRLVGIFSSTDLSTMGRVASYSGALDQFFTSPLTGDFLEEHTTGYYPHNLVLESLMATGIIGGVPFVALTMMSLWLSLKLIVRRDDNLWLGMLNIQYLIAAQTSSSLYLSTAMWTLMGATIQIATTHEGVRGYGFMQRIRKVGSQTRAQGYHSVEQRHQSIGRNTTPPTLNN
jgi:O-antigen ligase